MLGKHGLLFISYSILNLIELPLVPLLLERLLLGFLDLRLNEATLYSIPAFVKVIAGLTLLETEVLHSGSELVNITIYLRVGFRSLEAYLGHLVHTDVKHASRTLIRILNVLFLL